MQVLASIIVLSCLVLFVWQAIITRFAANGDADMENVECLLSTGTTGGAVSAAVLASVNGALLPTALTAAALGAAGGFVCAALLLALSYRRATGHWPVISRRQQ